MYNKNPVIRSSGEAYAGVSKLVEEIQKERSRVVVIDTYHCPDLGTFLDSLKSSWFEQATWFDTREALKSSQTLEQEFQEYITDDPVFGRTCDRDIDIYFETDAWLTLCRQVRSENGPIVVVGPGAMSSPIRSYADLAVLTHVPRETVFLSTIRNLGDEVERSTWARYKRNFYVDWPVQNRHQFSVLPASDILVDLTEPTDPTFVKVPELIASFEAATRHPFRIRSLFMPGVWGGTRLQELIPDLPEEWPNCAWGFEVVAPENTVTFQFGEVSISVAFDMFMHFQPKAILGHKHHRKYGDFFPVRFDFLDTINGTNLSCQVHPDDAYINAHFREPFAQTETYYIMEAEPDAKVYLGVTEETDKEKFLSDVAKAVSDSEPFEISIHVNELPAEKGDLFLIPPGTVHCSGAGNLVLEISATPYIYTFKLYDYLRLDLDGNPRPISYHRAFEVLNFERRTEMVKNELVAKPTQNGQGQGWTRYLLADHPLLFHIIERIELSEVYSDNTESSGVHVLCVVDGPGVTIQSQDGTEQKMAYAETVIIPADCGSYQLKPWGPSKVIKCYLR